ncbi:hypothetical protein J2Z44_001280 [Clostridium punense]|uniref:DUF3990 domain-containing protein n=1 Tax=Clostridium punense TaxID=1054297 RepID=A0ABS4K4C9_9CLOT|nr:MULTISPECIES: DUF3990 domain-containing protein [Clostridium]EQB87905.1 hypothetical protein M918_06700 [Clostridium sp. BL8]MBP2021484.1 hypothetical protein [Clostridium punense]
MILYHGSNVEVQHPNLIKANRTLDFGNGFYTTTNKEQAYKWAQIKKKRENNENGYISIYEVSEDILDNKDLNIIVFSEASKEWLEFVINNRMNVDYKHSYDIIKGPVADDRVYACLNAFENKFMDMDTAIRELKTYELADQISFHSEKAIGILEFINSEVV